ncbi:glycosyl hydrolase family 95 catalytic domain-containing protein [Acrocarpospora catenulata]|uniref:glycosyl hydrolase family 95 catalytic domain-containing protein n=1 Tax=Acrocarpospora catenulata TaxID=2836182 RepID=UPI001BDA9701|nr:glycoside hydrolase N-terminal domain-containing protein [Acrocarpospora catenulata]
MISGVNGFTSRTPAPDWEHALITGNGHQGALIHGTPKALHVTLSHEHLFLPAIPPLDPPDTARILPSLRALLYSGAYQEAADLVLSHATAENPAYTNLRDINPLISAATLTFHPLAPLTSYTRSCDFTTGVVAQGAPVPSPRPGRSVAGGSRPPTRLTLWVRDRLRREGWLPFRHTRGWLSGDSHPRSDPAPPEGRIAPPGTKVNELTQQVVASRPDDLIVIRLTGDVSGCLTLAPPPGTPPIPIAYTTTNTGNFTIRLIAAFTSSQEAESFGNLARHGDRQLEHQGNTGYRVDCQVTAEGGHLWSSGSSVEVRGATAVTITARVVVGLEGEEPRPRDFAEVMAEHAAVHGELFGRSQLRLTTGEAVVDSEEVIQRGGEGLVEALYAAGRYAIISSIGELPPTLQGVWSGTFTPAWQSGYTIDGNFQAAVAALMATGTPELMLPAFDLFDRLLPDFRQNTQRLYGCRGILTPVHISTHGLQNHFGPRWCQTFWTAGAAWLSRLYFDYFSYTRDETFLRERAIPFMTETATFYEDFLDERGNFVPSYSPENAPPGHTTQAAINATMDLAAVRDLLRNLDRVAPDPRWRRLTDRLPEYRTTPSGELAEWAWDMAENHAHRHASHLYPFWYEPDQTLATPGAAAIRKRLDWWRGEEADEMAFGLTQLGLAAAGLGLTAEAHEALTLLTTRYWRPNLVSTHNRDAIFNVDICGGVPALIAAMLLRSTDFPVAIDLLPACPWEKGQATGLLARGGIRVDDLIWSKNELRATLTATETTTARVNGRQLHLEAGRPTRFQARTRPNPG